MSSPCSSRMEVSRLRMKPEERETRVKGRMGKRRWFVRARWEEVARRKEHVGQSAGIEETKERQRGQT